IGISALLAMLLAALALTVMASQAQRGQAGTRGAAASGPCDRACLTAIADTYFAAVAAHDPAKAPMAATARFTENSKVLPLSEGLWKTATEVPTTFKIVVADPTAQQVGGIVMMKDADKPVELAFRLKVVNRQITEAEHIVARQFIGAGLANLVSPRPSFSATVPPADRLPRELMLIVGNSYYDSIVQNDGTAAPYGDDCERHENGGLTSGGPGTGNQPPAPAAAPAGTRGAAAPRGGGGGAPVRRACKEEMTARWLSYITSIDLRRVWIADEERGLIFGLTMFRQPMEEKTLTLLNPDGTTSPRPMTNGPFDFESAHVFKISGGKLHDIEALGISLPLYSKNGWSDFIR
ncbi:MAG TPA: hypothetical protein VK210_17760, partial [Terriglobia bacterium]|nr:hypothetical protein [Terriglobia bacterium]